MDVDALVGIVPSQIALMIIDMQNDYGHPNGYQRVAMGHDISRVRTLIPRIARLADRLRRVGGHVVYTLSARSPGSAERDLHKVLPRLMRDSPWRGGPVEGTWGAGILEELNPQPGDIVVRKFRYDAFFKTDLEEILRQELGVTTLLFTGVALNGCVESTLRGAFYRDFDVLLASDCVCALAHPYQCDVETATLETIDMHFGLVTDSETILRCWEQAHYDIR